MLRTLEEDVGFSAANLGLGRSPEAHSTNRDEKHDARENTLTRLDSHGLAAAEVTSAKLKTIGRHVIAELYGCNSDSLDRVETVRTHMVAAAEIIGATVVNDAFHKFAPQGVSGTVVIAESHLSIHTWPEVGYVAIDIYTCGGLNPRLGFEYLGRALEAKSCRTQEILRGLPEHLEQHGQLLPEDVQIITKTAEVSEITPAS